MKKKTIKNTLIGLFIMILFIGLSISFYKAYEQNPKGLLIMLVVGSPVWFFVVFGYPILSYIDGDELERQVIRNMYIRPIKSIKDKVMSAINSISKIVKDLLPVVLGILIIVAIAMYNKAFADSSEEYTFETINIENRVIKNDIQKLYIVHDDENMVTCYTKDDYRNNYYCIPDGEILKSKVYLRNHYKIQEKWEEKNLPNKEKRKLSLKEIFTPKKDQ